MLFDINRGVAAEGMLRNDPRTVFDPLLGEVGRAFDLTVVGNEREGSARVLARTELHGENGFKEPIALNDWPPGVYSLSHVALPFPPDDPVYGGPAAGKSPGVQLGNLALRGEVGVLRVSGSDLLRLRWNPFFDYVKARVVEFMGLGQP